MDTWSDVGYMLKIWQRKKRNDANDPQTNDPACDSPAGFRCCHTLPDGDGRVGIHIFPEFLCLWVPGERFGPWHDRRV